jgi:multidrug efflux pump subunit AcrA (membrane-fusion protein)
MTARSVLGKILGWITPVAILAAGVAAFVLLGSQPPPEQKPPQPRGPTPVRTVEVLPETGGLTIETDGVVVPLREVRLAAEVSGRIVRKVDACREGRFVTAGTLLLEIDPRDYQLDVDRLERELRQSELAIEELDEEQSQNETSMGLARQQVELASREVARVAGLKASRVVTEAEHERSLREELAARNSLTMLEGQRRVLVKRRSRLLEASQLAATALDRARLDLSRTRVLAPTDGIIVEASVEQDSYVARGMPLVTIEDTGAAEIRTSLQMDEVARVWGGRALDAGRGVHDVFDTPATVVFNLGGAMYEWNGTLSRQEGRGLDERTRTLPCRVIVPDPQAVRALDRYGVPLPQLPPGAPRSLLRGMFVQVRVHVDPAEPLVSIPEEARRPGGDLWVSRDGRLDIVRAKPVQIAQGKAIYQATNSGIDVGDRIIVSPLANARPGQEVVEEQVLEQAARDATGPAAAAREREPL